MLLLVACTQTHVVSTRELEQRYAAATRSFEAAFSTFEANASLGQEFTGNLKPLAEYLRAVTLRARDDAARQRAAVYMATMPSYSTDLSPLDYRLIADVVPASSREWAAAPESIQRMSEGLVPNAAADLLREIARRNPDRVLQGSALVALAKMQRSCLESGELGSTYAQLQSYTDIPGLRFPIRLLNPENRLAVGKVAPPLTLPDLDTHAPFDDADLRGKYYLIDFWATWCGPCLGERAVLSRAYRLYKARNFAIVSVSLDHAPQDAIRYRVSRWSMPWTNLFLAGGLDSETARNFELDWIGIPHLLLVSPQGRILALRDQLEGRMLERTLNFYLRAGSPPANGTKTSTPPCE